MEHVSVADIILAVDEPIDSTQCGGKENCHNDNKCITHDLWKNLNALIFNHLGSINLKQLVDEQKLNKENIIKIVDIHKLTSNQEYTSS
jgi:Rrf2 family iron-sulfur cluster assembly transcriptional regulator